MKLEISVEQLPPEGDAPPDRVEILQRKLQRAKWFDHARRRFDLVAFDELADWCAQQPGSVARNAEHRTRALRDLEDAVIRGEFGPPEKPNVAHLPRRLPTYGQASFPLRLTAGQIALLRDDAGGTGADLWAPRAACVQWLQARGVQLPPWLRTKIESAAPAAAAEQESPPPPVGAPATPKLPPFDHGLADAILVAMKVKGEPRPTGKEAIAIIERNFETAPRDPVLGIVRKRWGPGKPGRRPSAK